jgi:predicted nucleic acid-binding protein
MRPPELATFFVELPEITRICRDPDDDKVIATAVYGKVDYLITADEDLRTTAVIRLLESEGIEILTIDELIVELN